MRALERITLPFLPAAMLCATILVLCAATSTPFLVCAATGTRDSLTLAVPELALDKTEIDLGVLDQQFLTSASVVLRNDGSAVLVLEDIQRSGCCGSFEWSLADKEIQPGESEILEISFDSDNLSGTIEETFKILSNDPINREKLVRIKAEVHPQVAIIPQRITVRNPGAGVVHRNVIIKNISVNRLVISRIESSSDALTAVSHGEGNTIVLDISIDGAKLARGSHELVLVFSGPKPIRRTITITILGD